MHNYTKSMDFHLMKSWINNAYTWTLTLATWEIEWEAIYVYIHQEQMHTNSMTKMEHNGKSTDDLLVKAKPTHVCMYIVKT